MIVAEGREEELFQKAKDQYAEIQRVIVSGNILDLYSDVPRLIPKDVVPQPVEKVMPIIGYDKGIAELNNRAHGTKGKTMTLDEMMDGKGSSGKKEKGPKKLSDKARKKMLADAKKLAEPSQDDDEDLDPKNLGRTPSSTTPAKTQAEESSRTKAKVKAKASKKSSKETVSKGASSSSKKRSRKSDLDSDSSSSGSPPKKKQRSSSTDDDDEPDSPSHSLPFNPGTGFVTANGKKVLTPARNDPPTIDLSSDSDEAPRGRIDDLDSDAASSRPLALYRTRSPSDHPDVDDSDDDSGGEDLGVKINHTKRQSGSAHNPSSRIASSRKRKTPSPSWDRTPSGSSSPEVPLYKKIELSGLRTSTPVNKSNSHPETPSPQYSPDWNISQLPSTAPNYPTPPARTVARGASPTSSPVAGPSSSPRKSRPQPPPKEKNWLLDSDSDEELPLSKSSKPSHVHITTTVVASVDRRSKTVDGLRTSVSLRAAASPMLSRSFKSATNQKQASFAKQLITKMGPPWRTYLWKEGRASSH